MTLVETLKFVHVAAAIVWVGGAFMIGVMFERAQRSQDEGTVLGLTRIGEFAGKAVFNPAGILVLVAGIWLVIESDGIDFSEAWISLGFLGVALGAGLGMAFYPKILGRVRAGIEDDGLLSNETLAALRRLRLVSSLEWVFLLVVVWAMVFKPGA